jgi:hemolysin III
LQWVTRTVTEVPRPNFDHIHGVPRPRWRGVLHAAGAVVAIPAGAAVTLLAHGIAIIAVGVFAAALTVTFSISAAYHRVARTLRSQQIMRRADHAGIYLLIAGTYTPICLLALPRSWGAPLLVGVWVVTLLGATLKLAGKAWRVATAMYLILGWVAVVTVPTMWDTAGVVVTGLVISGGVVYTLGAVAFLTGRPRLSPDTFGHHELWHLATLGGAGLHFAAVATLTI